MNVVQVSRLTAQYLQIGLCTGLTLAAVLIAGAGFIVHGVQRVLPFQILCCLSCAGDEG